MRTELEQNAAPGEAPKVAITSVDEYEVATERVQQLSGCLEGTPEEAELEALVDAIAAWDAKHDDATRWK